MFTRTPRGHARFTKLLVVASAAAMLSDCSDRPTAPVRSAASIARRDVSASTITVSNTNDAGPGSLRDALATAPDGSTIQFDPSIAGQTIDLASGELETFQSLTINGPVPGGITIRGAGPVFHAARSQNATPPTVTLRDLTITGGSSPGPAGGIENDANMTIDHVLVFGNTAAGSGGGVLSLGNLTVINSTITANSATGAGNGIATPIGGGIFSGSGDLTVTNTSVVGNSAADGGGGLYFFRSTGEIGMFTLANSIVAANTNLAGSYDANCVAAAPPGQLFSAGTNLSDDSSCGASSPSMLVADPRLGTLADNGGPTRTIALLRDSPAIDAATNCTVVTDQRYVARPQGLACDIGAYEFNNFESTPLIVDDAVMVSPNTGAAIASGTVTCPADAFIATLHVALSEPQKGRVPATVSASGDLRITCGGPGTQNWAISLTPATGAFSNGSGTVAASTSGAPKFVLPASVNAAVKLYWGHK